MSDFYVTLISMGIMLAEAWAMILLWDAFALRHYSGWKYWCPILVMIALEAMWLNLYEPSRALKVVVIVATHFFVVRFLYTGKWYVLLFAVVVSIVLLQAVDNVVFMGCSVLSGVPVADLFEGYASFMILVTLSKTLEILLAYIFKRQAGMRLGYPQKDWRSWLQTLPLPLITCGFMAAATGLVQKYPNSAPAFLACSAALLTASVIQMSIVEQLDRQRAARQEQQLLRQNQELQQQRMEALRTAYEDQRRLTHDFKNELSVLLGLLHENQTSRAVELLQDLQSEVLGAGQVVETQNPLLDAILNPKYIAARECGVTLEFELQNADAFQLAPKDAAVVLGNLLDNAIEAARQVPEPKKVICRLWVEEEETVLVVKNTVAAPVELVDGWIQGSTKANRETHGYGLRNVRDILERHGGEIGLSCKEGWFVAAALLPQNPALAQDHPALAQNC